MPAVRLRSKDVNEIDSADGEIMSDDAKFKAAVYAASLKSAIAMGDRIKTVSWFGRNRKRSHIMLESKHAA